MKKVRGVSLAVALFLVLDGSSIASASSIGDDWLYDMFYNAGVQAAEEAGYTNYEIIVDDDYNVTINVLDGPKDTDAPAEEEAKAEEKRESRSEKTTYEPEEKRSSEEELTLGLQELEKENLVEAMQHFLRALPNDEAEKLIAENSYDYVDELMFAEDYQIAQTFMLEHPFDGCEQMLAECNDHCFLLDLAKALNARWSISNQDSLTWPDKKVREWYQELVECETQYLDKYMYLGFSDPQLANYAYAYIGALQSQMTGATYYGLDSEKYNENWVYHGSDVRSRMIYLINKKYGLEIESSQISTLKDTVAKGYNFDYVYAVTQMLTEQLSAVEPSFEKDKYDQEYIHIQPLKLKNTSGYELTQYKIWGKYYDDKGTETNSHGLFIDDYGHIRDGEEIPWSAGVFDMVFNPFVRMGFECEFEDSEYNWHKFIVYPMKQSAWDGKEIITDGYKVSSETSITLEEANSYWTVHNGVFVPCSEFILRNNGGKEIKEAVIKCVFINKDDNTVWSREKYFAVSLSDSPLRSGQGRSVIAYSSEGYEKKTRKVANLEVEIYVNDKPIAKIDVTKP